jgi:AcrR family transcriptional regulator
MFSSEARSMPVAEIKPTALRILNTTESLLLSGAADRLTMEEIAREAEMGRATLYRHFKNRDEILLALMVREAQKLAQDAQNTLVDVEDPCVHIIEGMVLAVSSIGGSPLFAAIFTVGTVSRWLFMSDKLLAVGMEIIVPMIERAHEGAGESGIDMEILNEWIYRTLISLITIPSANTATPEAMRNMLHQTLMPLLRG